jgi:hypothetical protein
LLRASSNVSTTHSSTVLVAAISSSFWSRVVSSTVPNRVVRPGRMLVEGIVAGGCDVQVTTSQTA